MYVASKHQKLFHWVGCHNVSRIDKSNRIHFNTQEQARAAGYAFGNCCSPTYRKYKKNIDNINKFTRKNNIKIFFEDDSLYVDHGISSWKITTKSNSPQLMLYHANSEKITSLKHINGRLERHYHDQQYKGRDKTILGMLKYIIEHDDWKENNLDSYKNLPRHTKKQKSRYKQDKRRSDKIKAKRVRDIIDLLAEESKYNEDRH